MAVIIGNPGEGGGGGPDLSDADPAPLGSADPGMSEEASRADHMHDRPTPLEIGAATEEALDAEVLARQAGDAASLDAVTDLGNNITAAFGPALDAKANTADLGDAAALDVGTTAGTVAAGDDERITGALPAMVSSSGTGVYTADTNGNQWLWNLRSTAQQNSVPIRTTGGQMRVGEAVLADAAVNKEQFDTALDAKANTADVDTALAGKADLATPWSPRSGFMYVIPEDIPNPLGLHGLSVGVTRWSWRDAAGPWEIESVGVQAGALGAAPSTWMFYVHLLGPDGPGELLGQSAPLLATVENGLHVISFASPVTVPAWATFGVGVQCISGGDTLLRQLGQYQSKFSSYANVATNNVYGWQANGTAPHGSFPTVGPNQGGSYSPKIYVGIA